MFKTEISIWYHIASLKVPYRQTGTGIEIAKVYKRYKIINIDI